LTLRDSYGRTITNLRVSITQRCALNCFFCHREGQDYRSAREMSPAEIERVVQVAASFGVSKVKITGGEPLLRKDITEIVRRVSAVPNIQEVALTTNGINLATLARPLKANGLRRVNVSLPSLDSEVYQAVTGTDAFTRVLAGIHGASAANLAPIKVNMVVLKGLNEHQVWDLIGFTQRHGLILQLIEFESPDPTSRAYLRYHADLAPIEAKLEAVAREISVRDTQKRRKFFLRDGGEVEVVRPMHNTEFCAHCNKLRVTSDGKFKPCLFRADNLTDFLTPLRAGASDAVLAKLYQDAVTVRRPYFA
jgi:cyclic pyranopterin phosphate synthase